MVVVVIKGDISGRALDLTPARPEVQSIGPPSTRGGNIYTSMYIWCGVESGRRTMSVLVYMYTVT